MTILVARLLGFNQAGIFALSMSLSNIFFCIAVYGMRSYQASDVSDKYSDRVYILSRIITCIIALLICAIVVFINPYTFYQKACVVAYMIFKISEALDVYKRQH